MNKEEMEILGKENQNLMKLSRRDLPYAVSQKLTGGTTVSSTSMIAEKMGIKIFVTGGIGGVHQDVVNSMDISSDLTELAHTQITVISAGVKSILDIEKTLEYLETVGVCVVSFGQSKEFPAFFTSKSGYFAPYNVLNANDAAKLIVARDSINMRSAVLIAVPIPQEYDDKGQMIEDAIKKAVLEAKEKNVKGKDVTPFILKKVNDLTLGESLKSNILLIKNNAVIGSKIAIELHKIHSFKNSDVLEKNNKENILDYSHSVIKTQKSNKLVVIGGSVLDLVTTVLHSKIEHDGRSYSGKIQSSAGGVGRNIADCLSRLGKDPLLISTIGDDRNGKTILNQNTNMDVQGIRVLSGVPSAVYCAILNVNGQCLFGIKDMKAHDFIDMSHILKYKRSILESPLIVLDGNVPQNEICQVLQLCRMYNKPVWYEPTDIVQAKKPFLTEDWKSLTYSSPNYNELRMMYSCVSGKDLKSLESEEIERIPLETIIKCCIQLSEPLMHYLHTLIVTLGAKGVLVVTKSTNDEKFPIWNIRKSKVKPSVTHFPSEKCLSVVSVSGAGDCFAAATIASIIDECDRENCVRAGIRASILSLKSYQAVPNDMTSSILNR
ncbi:uncharacterized protein [Centruroides vittatus]